MAMSHNSLELLSLAMDVTLVAVSIWMASNAAKLKLGGAMGETVSSVVWGAIVLGLAHIVETGLTKMGVEGDLNEVIHRVIILLGFILLARGIRALVGAFAQRK